MFFDGFVKCIVNVKMGSGFDVVMKMGLFVNVCCFVVIGVLVEDVKIKGVCVLVGGEWGVGGFFF